MNNGGMNSFNGGMGFGNNNYNSGVNKKVLTKVIVIGVIFIGIVCTLSVNFNNSVEVHTATITDTVIKRQGETDIYLVYTKSDSGNIAVYENSDSFIKGKYNSSDLQAKLEKGKKFKLTVVGYRLPVISSYQNILSAEEIK